jgi:hypothetical protein
MPFFLRIGAKSVGFGHFCFHLSAAQADRWFSLLARHGALRNDNKSQ